jgi:hypothetical protein
MKITVNSCFYLFALLALFACSGDIEESTGLIDSDPEHIGIISKDLLAIISVHEASCRAVTDYTKQSNLDYVATCVSGERFRVHVSPEGTVEVELVVSPAALPGVQ